MPATSIIDMLQSEHDFIMGDEYRLLLLKAAAASFDHTKQIAKRYLEHA